MPAFVPVVLLLLQARLPEPARKEVQAAEQSVRAAFKDDYARKTPELPVRLLQAAVQTQQDPAGRYVLLREARDLAAEAGLAGIAAQAVDALLKEYELDRKAALTALCGVLNRTVKTPGALRAYAQACRRWSDAAAADDSFEAAGQLLGHADGAARKARDVDLTASLQERSKELAELKRLSGRAKAAEKTLKDKPDDGAARADLGRWLCFGKDDWAAGLPHLAQAPEADLKALAAKDVAAPASPEARLELGDAWTAWAEKQGALKGPPRERGLSWYRQAWPELAGLPREKLRARFRALAERPEGKGREAPGVPRGWIVAELAAGEKPEGVAVDEAFARGGRRSLRLAGRPKGIAATERAALQPGRKLQVSFWILADRAEDFSNQCALLFVSTADASTGIVPIPLPGDRPWWTRVEMAVDVPANTAFVRFSFAQKFAQGTVWLDEVSLRHADDGTELVENGGLEDR